MAQYNYELDWYSTYLGRIGAIFLSNSVFELLAVVFLVNRKKGFVKAPKLSLMSLAYPRDCSEEICAAPVNFQLRPPQNSPGVAPLS